MKTREDQEQDSCSLNHVVPIPKAIPLKLLLDNFWF